jgi:hypothetical protein
MDTALWNTILDFNLDQSLTEYGFSERLQYENYWTTSFAQQAIIEYKKFMYLAAVSNEMVSPSEIIDVVWHQHLLFSASYDKLCSLIGKKILHVPSTHESSDVQKFKEARKRTTILYLQSFGDQPAQFWVYPDMTSSLNMEPSRFSIQKIAMGGLIMFLLLLIVEFLTLSTIYTKINNPYFLLAYLSIAMIMGVFVHYQNKRTLRGIIKAWPEDAFISNFSPIELIYLKTGKIEQVIHGVVNQLVVDGKLRIFRNQTLGVAEHSNLKSAAELTAVNAVHLYQKITYPYLVSTLKTKPAYRKTINMIDEFERYILESNDFIDVFKINLLIILTFLSFGFSRVAIGHFRDRPILLISGVMIVLSIAGIFYLIKLKSLFKNAFINAYYSEEVLTENAASGDWEWNYLLVGSAFFVNSFEPFVTKDRRQYSSGDSDYGSDGSAGDGHSGDGHQGGGFSGGGDAGGDTSGGGDAGGCGSSCGGCGGGGD